MATSLFGTGRNWTGAASANWSDPNNWSPAGTPQNGDDLGFGFVDDSRRSMVNDIPDLAVEALNFADNDYQIDGNPLTILGAIFNMDDTGTGNFNNSHTTTVNCPLAFPHNASVYTGGQPGAFTETTIDLHLNGPITIVSGELLLEAISYPNDLGMGGGNGHLYVSGVVSGSGNIVAAATEVDGHVSPVEFNGTPGNSFSGTLYLNTFYGDSPIIFNKTSGFVVTNRVAVRDGDTAKLQLAGPNQIGNSATIEITAGSQLVLIGNSVTVGNLILTNFSADAKASVLDTGSTTVGLNGAITSWNDNESVIPAIKGKINLNGFLPFTIGGSAYAGLELQAPMGSAGGFAKSGNAALLLETNNTFSGAISVDQGILEVRQKNALGSIAGSTTLTGSGSLTLRNVSIAGETLFVRGDQPATADTTGSLLFTIGTCSWNGPIELDANLAVWADNTTLSGQISGVGGLDFRGGTAILGGSGGNTFAGTTLVRCPLLKFNKPYGVRAFAGPLVVGGGAGGPYEARWINSYQNGGPSATLYANGIINLYNYVDGFGPVTFNGGEVDTGTGEFDMYAPITVNAADTSAVINGNLGLPAGDNRVFIVGDGAPSCDLLVNAVVLGTPNAFVVKQGPGTMCLANANSYDATTLLEEGILEVSNGSGLGTAVGTIIFDGATLRLGGAGITLAENIEVLGAGVGGTHGAVEVTADSVLLLTGEVFLDGASTFNVVGPNARVTLTGPVFGTGPVIKTGAGNLTFQGANANTYSGDTIVMEGVLNLAKSANVPSVPHNLVVGPASANSSAVARHSQVGGMGGDVVTVNANSLVDLNGYNQTLSRLNLNDGGNVQTRGGTLSFAGDALIAVGSQSSLGSHASSTISGNIGLPANALLTFSVNPHASTPPLLFTPELDVPAFIPAPGENPVGIQAGIAKEGLGRMRLGANNSYRGPLQVNDGTVIAANAGALGSSAGSTFVNNNAMLAIDGGIAILNETLFLNSSHTPALQSLSGSNTWSGPITLSQKAGIDVQSANDFLQVLGAVSGPGGLTKLGPGTLQFWGTVANTYSGLSTVAGGSLDAGRANFISIPGDVVIGDDTTPGYVAALRVLREQQLKSTANVAVHGSGLFSLLDFPGVPPVVQVRTLTGRGLVHLDPSCALTISNDISFSFDGLFEGSGSLTKLGPARMQWTGIGSTYSGSAILNAGDFLMNGTAPSMAVQVHSGALLHGDGQMGGVNVFANGMLGVESKFPDHQGGDLGVAAALLLANGSVLSLDFFGPSPTGGNDQIVANSSVFLGNSTFQGTFHYPAREGDVITLLHKTVAGAINGTFLNWPGGSQQLVGKVPVIVNYSGGSGNDVTLTVTNLALTYFTYRLEEGNGNQTVEPDECNLLYVTLLNARSVPLTITRAVLRALTPGVVATIASAPFPDIPAFSGAENLTPFQFRTDASLPCAASVSLELVLDVIGEGQFAVVVTPFSGTDCTHPTGPCESCTVVSGQFTTNTPAAPQPLYFVGAPSICYPPKACPGVDPGTNLPPIRYRSHSLANSTTNEVCITAQLKFDCPRAQTNALGVAAYLGSFDPNQPCAGYLGDSGQGEPPYPPFSFRVPPGSNFVVVVSARSTNLVCDNYSLELFGLPCPSPTLAIAHEAAPSKVRVHWSTAYPGWTAQQENKTKGTFSDLTQVPVIVAGKYALTNMTATTSNRFYRLKK